MRPIAPRTGAPEITIAEEQEEYMPITVARYYDPGTRAIHIVTRYTFSPEERLAIANGEDVYIAQLSFNGMFAPQVVSCGPGQYADPEI